jgi:diguanylate cyclase (GGDEF)-like protein
MSHRSEEAGGDRHAGGLHGGRGASRSTRIRHALRAVKEGNASLLHAADEAGLLQRVCRVIVEEGGYRTAFVGYADEGGGGRVRIVAHAGMEGHAHEGAGFAAAKLADPEGPLGAALRTGEPAVGTMFAEDAQLAFWQDEARKQGHAAATAFPLRVEGATIGALCICAAEPTAFDEAEEQLLGGLADDLAFGIAALRTRGRQHDSEAQLARVNRALRTVSAGNRSLLRATSEQELLQEMCRVINEEGGYPLAWVGYAERDAEKSVRVMARAGGGGGCVDVGGMAKLTWADTGLGLGPTGTAIRTGEAAIGRNLHADPSLAEVRKAMVDRGFTDYVAVSVFPLRVDGEVIGNLSIYALEPEAFDEAEAHLLAELADDLAYGIANLRERARRAAAERTIERLAFHDGITGLPNRTRLREELERAIRDARRQGRPLGLLVLKVEQFQEITDSLGYREGEHLLHELAGRLAPLVHDEARLARGGEDEFVVLLPGAGASHATDAAQRLIAALHEPIELSGLMVSARVNVGIALSPGHGSDPDALLRRASVAACEARRSASGYAVYVGGLDQDCTRRLALMGELRQAIAHNGLQLYCQPKVCFGSGRVCGAEALVRWPHPEIGMVATSEFVPLAEQAGLISSLTHWVLEAAFAQAYAWHEAGVREPLAVNLSAHDLRDPSLLERVKGLFATWGARPDWIQFELTESALMVDPAGALETLGRLKQLGVELYIDDFGTGYSSLSYLQKLPVDAIKIDQSFVGSMIDSEDSSIIVRSTIELGHNLDLRVVAEGVETERIWDGLARLGCDTAQGYFVSRPMPAERFREWESASRWHH